MLQGYNDSRLKSLFRKFYGHYNDLACLRLQIITGPYAELFALYSLLD
jgi:hypothetical protein